jgi:hypothetical protein
MKPKPALAVIAIGLVLVVAGVAQSIQPAARELWLIAVGITVIGLILVSVGLIGMARGLSE